MFNEIAANQGELLTLNNENQMSSSNQPPKKIGDLGEKIGGARKDTAQRGPRRPKAEKVLDENAGKPAWFRRFAVFENTQSVFPFNKLRWRIADKLKKGSRGSPALATRREFSTKEEALAAIPLLALAQNHRARRVSVDGIDLYKIYRAIGDRKQVQVVSQVFSSETEAMQYMSANVDAILNTNTTFGEADLPIPTAYQRVGPKWRSGDAQGNDFLLRFDVRGVEFGNWNNQDDRQFILNAAYDGLMDLADVLKLDPARLGLFGDLALAFGARGQGLSSARAHFEPSKVAINLTKMKGAGSLGHEWAHSFDNLLAKLEGKATKNWQTDKDGTRSIAPQAPSHAFLSHGTLVKNSQTSPALKDAFNRLIEALFQKPEVYEADTANAAKHVAIARDRLAQQIASLRTYLATQKPWGQRFRDPASQSQLEQFDCLAIILISESGDKLKCQYVEPDGKRGVSLSAQTRWTNNSLEALSVILKQVRGSSGFNSERNGQLDSLVRPIKNLEARREALAVAQNGELKTKKVPTDFAMAATELDQGRGENYWLREHEMFARAFSAYVDDALAEQGRISNYLNYAPAGSVIPTPWGFFSPYPQGDERKAFNALFDQVFAIVRAEWNTAQH